MNATKFTGERRLRELPDPLLHRHRGGDERDLHVQPHVEALREVLPPGHGRRLQRDPRSKTCRHRSRALRDAHADGHRDGVLQQSVLRSKHDDTGKNVAF